MRSVVVMDCGQYFVFYSLVNGFLGPGKTTSTRSHIECTVLCQSTDGCTSYFYRDEDKLCQLSSTWHFSSDGLTPTPGYKYYMKPADDPCDSKTCNGHGTCAPGTNNPPTAICSCNVGYIGDHCQLDDPCDSKTCNGHGTCAPGTNNPPTAICSCNVGYIGDNCQLDTECGAWTFQSDQRYLLISNRRNSHDAEVTCQSCGGHLAIVESEVDLAMIISVAETAGSREFWIGGSDEAVEGRWVWQNGQNIPAYVWNSNEPNGGSSEDCLQLKYEGEQLGGNDAGCNANYDFMCQK